MKTNLYCSRFFLEFIPVVERETDNVMTALMVRSYKWGPNGWCLDGIMTGIDWYFS